MSATAISTIRGAGGRSGSRASPDGQLVEPANFGEFFLLTGRSTVVTDSVSGHQRRQRRQAGDHSRARQAASDSVLRVGDRGRSTAISSSISTPRSTTSSRRAASRSTCACATRSPRTEDKIVPSTMHALMYTKRTPVFQPGEGFDEQRQRRAVHGARRRSGDELGVHARRRHARQLALGLGLPRRVHRRLHDARHAARPIACTRTIVIGGPGLDGSRPRSRATNGDTRAHDHGHGHARRRAGGGRARPRDRARHDVPHARDHRRRRHVHAARARRRRTSTSMRTSAATRSAPPRSAPARRATIDLPATGSIHVVATENGARCRCACRSCRARARRSRRCRRSYGEPRIAGGRLHVEYAVDRRRHGARRRPARGR